jgi:predicted permease
MLDILLVTAPIYLIIALGFGAVRLGLFEKADMRLIGRLLVLIILPIMVFRTISLYDIDDILQWDFLTVYLLASVFAWVLAHQWARRWRGHEEPMSSFMAMGMSGSNSVFVGYPILSQLIGPAADVALALCLLVENVIMYPMSLVMADRRAGQSWSQALRHAGMSVLRNPILVAIVLGVLCATAGWHLPALLDRTAALVASAAAPLALFMIGGILVGQRVRGMRLDLTAVTFGKLVLHPALTLAVLWALPIASAPMALAAVAMAAMPLPSLYPALGQRHGIEGFCAAALVTVTVVSFFTINAWLWLLPAWLPHLVP